MRTKEEYIELMSQADELMARDKDFMSYKVDIFASGNDYPTAEEIMNKVISEVEDSDFYREDVKNGTVSFPYSKMYELKANSLLVNTESIGMMEEAYKWAPDDYKLITRLLRYYFDYELYDRALELALKAFKVASGRKKESELFYAIRKIGEGCCWELTEAELEDGRDAVKNMKIKSHAEDFATYGIPASAAKIRAMDDDQISEIVNKCFSEPCVMTDITPKEKIRSHKDKCPYCGETRYYVTRSYVVYVDAYGNENLEENASDPFAVCYRCRNTIHVPWVDKKNREKREKVHREYMDKLHQKGYKDAGIDEVMEKYGIEDFTNLDDIIAFSCRAFDYDDDYEIGYSYLLQDMYDCPWIFVECMDSAESDFKEYGSAESAAVFDKIYENAVELSRQPCENLRPIYGVTPTAFVGTEEEDMQILINGVPIEYTPDSSNNSGIFAAIWRAVDKYNEMMDNDSNI